MNQQIVFRLAIDPGNVPAGAAQAEKSIAGIGKAAQVSAGQTAAAMRSLPAQMTDVITSLQGGQSPMTVLLQQGGQIKDMFGGVGPALRGVGTALAAAVTPTVMLAGASAGLLYAMYQGRQESAAMQKALYLTGNIAALTGGKFDDLGRDVQKGAGVTIGAAREITQAAVAQGQFGAQAIGAVSTAMASYAKATGSSVQETVTAFAELAKDPSAWAAALNKQIAFLTPSVYANMRALQEHGRVQEAATLAAQALTDKLTSQPQRLGAIETALKDATSLWSRFWDAALDVGRTETVEQRIARLTTSIAMKQGFIDRANSGGLLDQGIRSLAGSGMAQDREELARAKAVKGFDEQMARQEAAKTAANRAAIDAQDRLKRLRDETDQRGRLNDELRNYARIVADLRGTEQAISPADQARDVANLRRKYTVASENEAMQVSLQRVSDWLKDRQELYRNDVDIIDNLLKDGLVRESAVIRQRASIREQELRDERLALTQRIALLKQSPTSAKDQAAARGEIGRIDQQLSLLPAKTASDVQRADITEARKSYDSYIKLLDEAGATSARVSEQISLGMAALVTNPLKRAQAEADAAIQSLDQSVQRIREKLLDAVIAAEQRGDDAQARGLSNALNNITNAMPQAAQALRQKAIGEQVRDFVSQGNNVDFAAGFDKSSQSLGVFSQQFSRLIDMQTRYAELVKAAASDEQAVAALRESSARQQAAAYGNIAGAAKGFFTQGSAGYKLLSNTEKAFRAYEMAMALKSTAQKLGLLTTETAAKITAAGLQAGAVATGQGAETAAVAAGEAERNAAKVPGVFMAFMSALGPWGMAAAGVAIAAVLGGAFRGGGNSIPAANNGTGTVLGDPSAQSKSISNSIDKLRSVDTQTMRYSAAMLASLQSIENQIAGVSSLIVQSGGLTASTSGIQTGVSTSKLHSAEAAATRAALAWYTLGISEALGIGAPLERMLNRTMGTVKNIIGSGITAGPQSMSSVLANGFDARYFATVESKKKFIGITTSTSTAIQDAGAVDAETKRQFGLIIQNFADAVSAAAVPLGQSLDGVQSRLSSFVVDIGRIDLQGLTGDQISEKLTAVFGAMGDNIAKAALPGLDKFQQVGEGYLETVTRVATGSEEAQAALKRLGVGVISLADLAQAQAEDIGAELVRESIALREAGSGIGQIVQVLSGSASEVAKTYKSLTDVRSALQALGLSGGAVTFELLQGAGDLNSLTDGLKSYQENFLSKSQQIGVETQLLTKQFAALGIAMPRSKDQFVALVNGIDTSTAAGQALLGNVITLSGSFASLTDSIASVGSSIESEIKRIRGLTNTTDSSSFAAAQSRFAISTAQARAGNQDAIDTLASYSQDLLKQGEAVAGSRADLQRLQAQVAASLEETLAYVRGGSVSGAGVSGAAVGTGAGASSDAAGSDAAAAAAAQDGGFLGELAALRTEVAAFRQENQIGQVQLAANTGKLNRLVESMMGPDAALRITTDGAAPIETTVV